jgi:hypothetical protein
MVTMSQESTSAIHRARKERPALFWTVVLLVGTTGTGGIIAAIPPILDGIARLSAQPITALVILASVFFMVFIVILSSAVIVVWRKLEHMEERHQEERTGLIRRCEESNTAVAQILEQVVIQVQRLTDIFSRYITDATAKPQDMPQTAHRSRTHALEPLTTPFPSDDDARYHQTVKDQSPLWRG